MSSKIQLRLEYRLIYFAVSIVVVMLLLAPLIIVKEHELLAAHTGQQLSTIDNNYLATLPKSVVMTYCPETLMEEVRRPLGGVPRNGVGWTHYTPRKARHVNVSWPRWPDVEVRVSSFRRGDIQKTWERPSEPRVRLRGRTQAIAFCAYDESVGRDLPLSWALVPR